MITCGDLNENALGAQVTLTLGGQPLAAGTLVEFSEVMGMVRLRVDEMTLGLPLNKPVEMTRDSLRDWILRESDHALRARLLDEMALLRVGGMLGELDTE